MLNIGDDCPRCSGVGLIYDAGLDFAPRVELGCFGCGARFYPRAWLIGREGNERLAAHALGESPDEAAVRRFAARFFGDSDADERRELANDLAAILAPPPEPEPKKADARGTAFGRRDSQLEFFGEIAPAALRPIKPSPAKKGRARTKPGVGTQAALF